MEKYIRKIDSCFITLSTDGTQEETVLCLDSPFSGREARLAGLALLKSQPVRLEIEYLNHDEIWISLMVGNEEIATISSGERQRIKSLCEKL